ncbi:MAG TPA: FkbM family methyltransferase [Candidatus Hydrogenedentes bacterium]|nr:FkbM family methyltransferase [Candidatus Hydrogenedentota bacterium]HQH54541.1 FkbM family methyltransferase [Candidatus Hydrogenedentota bacterium]
MHRFGTAITLDMPVTNLDQFAREAGLCRMDVLRIDVESFEHAVLGGARLVLSTLRPIIAVEILEAADCAAIDAIRREARYQSLYIAGHDILPQETVVYREGHDNQLLCPQERLPELRDCLEEAGCRPGF